MTTRYNITNGAVAGRILTLFSTISFLGSHILNVFYHIASGGTSDVRRGVCHLVFCLVPRCAHDNADGKRVIDKAGVHVSDENRSAFSKSNNMKCTSGSEIFCIVHEHRTSDALPSCVVWRRASVSGSATFGNVFLC